MTLFQFGPDRYRADASQDYALVNQRKLARIVGGVAFGIPIVLLIFSVSPVYGTCFRDSISHYYYAQFWGGPFVGALVFIGSFLLVYQGQDIEGAERRLANWAGFLALGVALLPTGGHGCDDGYFEARAMVEFRASPLELLPPVGADTLAQLNAGELDVSALAEGSPYLAQDLDAHYFQLTALAPALHYLSAAGLFLILAWFSLAVFTAVQPHQRREDGSLTPRKARRNRIYYLCGAVMLICMAAMGVYSLLAGDDVWPWWRRINATFIFEAAALVAFGVSWSVKGEMLPWLNETPDAAGG